MKDIKTTQIKQIADRDNNSLSIELQETGIEQIFSK